MTPHSLKPQVHGIFDPATWTVTYVVHNGTGSAAAIIDSVLDYDPKSGRTRTTSADKVIDYVMAQDLKVQWILETHAHADHLSAAPYLKQKLGGKIGIGDQITRVQKVFKGIFNLEPEFRLDGSQFDALLKDEEEFRIGDLTARVEAEYDQRITQRLILQPRAEVNFAAQDIPENDIGSGLVNIELGARLRYENEPGVAGPRKPERMAMEEVRRGLVFYDVPASKAQDHVEEVG